MQLATYKVIKVVSFLKPVFLFLNKHIYLNKVNQNQTLMGQPSINQIQQQQLQTQATSQSWININQQGNVQQLQQQQIYLNSQSQSGIPQQQKNQPQNFQYYQ